jgi:hypothetical protein
MKIEKSWKHKKTRNPWKQAENDKQKSEKMKKKDAPVTGIGSFIVVRERGTILCQQLRANCHTWQFTGPSST